jgi:hypothetical protein
MSSNKQHLTTSKLIIEKFQYFLITFIEMYEDLQRQIIEIDKNTKYEDENKEDLDDYKFRLHKKIDISIELYDNFYDKIIKERDISFYYSGKIFTEFIDFRDSVIETHDYITEYKNYDDCIHIELLNEIYTDYGNIYKEALHLSLDTYEYEIHLST